MQEGLYPKSTPPLVFEFQLLVTYSFIWNIFFFQLSFKMCKYSWEKQCKLAFLKFQCLLESSVELFQNELYPVKFWFKWI